MRWNSHAKCFCLHYHFIGCVHRYVLGTSRWALLALCVGKARWVTKWSVSLNHEPHKPLSNRRHYQPKTFESKPAATLLNFVLHLSLIASCPHSPWNKLSLDAFFFWWVPHRGEDYPLTNLWMQLESCAFSGRIGMFPFGRILATRSELHECA